MPAKPIPPSVIADLIAWLLAQPSIRQQLIDLGWTPPVTTQGGGGSGPPKPP